MNDVEARLRRCFSIVFPKLEDGKIESSSQTTVSDWDSVAAITLLALIEEEFRTTVDLERLPELTSFAAIRDYLLTTLTEPRPSGSGP